MAMTPQNLMDYVKVYKNHLSDDLCKTAVQNLSNVNWKEHTFYNPRNDTFESKDHELSVSFDDMKEKNEINSRVWFAIERYVLDDFKSFSPWWDGWEGYSSIRFNKYDPTTQMALHCDHITTIFDGTVRGIPVLTVLGVLNDDYEGGEFLMFGDEQIDLPAGSIVVFPSNFMFPHEVKPVKSGVRYSYVSWTW